MKRFVRRNAIDYGVRCCSSWRNLECSRNCSKKEVDTGKKSEEIEPPKGGPDSKVGESDSKVGGSDSKEAKTSEDKDEFCDCCCGCSCDWKPWEQSSKKPWEQSSKKDEVKKTREETLEETSDTSEDDESELEEEVKDTSGLIFENVLMAIACMSIPMAFLSGGIFFRMMMC